MNKYTFKSVSIFGKTFNTLIIGAVILSLTKEGVANAQVPYRLSNEAEGAAPNPSNQMPTTPVVIDAKDLPSVMSADNLVPLVVAEINKTSAVKIELEA